MADVDLARELFEIWDSRGVGELAYEQVEEHFIALGLAGHPEQALKILRTLKASTGSLDIESFSLKDFLQCFKPDKIGSLVCEKIN